MPPRSRRPPQPATRPRAAWPNWADRQAAALVRVQRAQHAAQAYETEHARELIAELEPDAAEAVKALERHAAELVAADRRWNNVSAEVSRLLQHVGNTAPHHNS
jgi:hypothetical protein